MKRTVLVVEDEKAIADVVEMYLDQGNFRTRLATTGAEARKQLQDPSIGLVLLDLGLPDDDGLEVLREIRTRGALPVIVVTARDGETDRILGLELGADDYVTKPFSPRELVARVKAVLRREERTETTDGTPVVAGSVRLDPTSREVQVHGADVELTRKEFDLLAYLVARPGRVLSRTQLLEAVWGYPDDVDSRTVDVHIAQLRRKLGDSCPLKTVRGVGYKADGG